MSWIEVNLPYSQMARAALRTQKDEKLQRISWLRKYLKIICKKQAEESSLHSDEPDV
jgi:hypothetical protein